MDFRHTPASGHARRQARRLDPEQLVNLAQALPHFERRLIEARFAEGLTFADLARRYHTEPRRLRRQIDRLTRRMARPEYRFALLHADQLPARLRKTATLLFVQGRSLRDTAQATGQTLHRVRTDRQTLQALALTAA